MNFADAAEEVLKQADGGPLNVRDITSRALDSGLVTATSAEPWINMQAALRQDTRRRQARGQAARFVVAGGGHFRLNTGSSEAETAVAAWNAASKERLRAQLGEIDPTAFEHLVGQLLERMGYEDIEVTTPSSDRGVDVRAVYSVGGGITRTTTAIQVKRRAKVPGEVVRALRGALSIHEQGLVITTGEFTKGGKEEARARERVSIGLIDGWTLVEILAQHGLGMTKRSLVLLDVDEELLSASVGEEPADVDRGSVLIEADTRRFKLFRLPGRNDPLTVLVRLLGLVPESRDVADFVTRLQSVFPNITRSDVALRHMRVLVAFGLATVTEQRVFLTPTGKAFLEKGDVAMLGTLLLKRVYGAAELYGLLQKQPMRQKDVYVTLQAAGLSRMTRTHAHRMVEWMLLTGLVRVRGEALVSSRA